MWKVKQALEEASKTNEGKISNANVVTYNWKVKRAAELLEVIMIEESDEEREKNVSSIRRLFKQCYFRTGPLYRLISRELTLENLEIYSISEPVFVKNLEPCDSTGGWTIVRVEIGEVFAVKFVIALGKQEVSGGD